jgi:hypothetical protein
MSNLSSDEIGQLPVEDESYRALRLRLEDFLYEATAAVKFHEKVLLEHYRTMKVETFEEHLRAFGSWSAHERHLRDKLERMGWGK